MGQSPTTEPARLAFQRVGKSFRSSSHGTRLVLSAIDLELRAGESVAIVGASGCGKSTLLRLAAGLELPDEGAVLLGGERVAGPAPDRGLVFQEHRLLPWLDVQRNVEFGLSRLDPASRRRTAEHGIALVGLAGFEQAYPHQLSGGMAQRAALARALAPNPGVLLLDEPFAALDALNKVKLQEELVRIRQASNPTSLLVTHDIEEAVFIADRVVVLSERPGTIRHVIDVPLTHPRVRTSEAFSRIRDAVHRHFSLPEAREPFSSAAPLPAFTRVTESSPFHGALTPRETP